MILAKMLPNKRIISCKVRKRQFDYLTKVKKMTKEDIFLIKNMTFSVSKNQKKFFKSFRSNIENDNDTVMIKLYANSTGELNWLELNQQSLDYLEQANIMP